MFNPEALDYVERELARRADVKSKVGQARALVASMRTSVARDRVSRTARRAGVTAGSREDSEEPHPALTAANWVEQTGGLPGYIRRIADHLVTAGMTESHAIAAAVNTVKRWCRGGGDVKPDTQAKACAALAEWEAAKAEARAT